MAKQENLVLTALVTEALGNSMFRAELDNSEHTILCHISGKMRQNYIRIIPGDRVEVEMSPYDLTKGRITRRLNVNYDNMKSNV